MQLLEGEEKAILKASSLIRTQEENIPLRKLLLHALAKNKNYPPMLPHLKKLQELGKITRAEREDIQRIEKNLPPKAYPIQQKD